MTSVAPSQTPEQNTTLRGLPLFFATIALSLATFMFVLDYTVCNVAIPYISGGLAAGIEEGTYVLTFFSVGNAVFIPLTGWLSSRFGIINTLVMAVVLFTFFSFMCGIAPSLFALVVYRFFQGAAAGPLVPLSQTILTKIYPREELTGVMTLFSMILLVAPVLGPVVGGYFCIYSDWRWIFFINVPIGIFSAIVIWATLKYLDRDLEGGNVDYISFFLLLVGMTSLQLFLDKGEQWDWLASHRIQICLGLTIVTLTYLVAWSFIHPKPLLKLRLFGINKAFTLSCILIATMYSLYMGTVVIVPLWLQQYQGYDALWAGIAVAPIGIGSVVMAPITGRLIPKIGRMIPIITGIIVMALASLYARNYYSDYSLYQVAMSRFVLGLGVGCWVVPIVSMPAAALKSENMSAGLGIFHFIRVISGAIGISVFTTMFHRRIIHQYFNLISVFNPYNPQTTRYMTQIKGQGLFGDQANALANMLLDQQAAAIAFNEVAQFMFWMCIAMLILSFFAIRWEKEVIEEHALEESQPENCSKCSE